MDKVIIIDVELHRDAVYHFNDFGLLTLSASDLNRSLVQSELWQELNRLTTLLVFPGNGASIVRTYLDRDWLSIWRWVTVPAQRFWQPGEAPQVRVGRVYPLGMLLGLRDIVLVDDVASSGKTASVLRKINEPWIPGARWHITTWVAQRSLRLRGFTTRQASAWVGSDITRAPINSLSTLLRYPDVARSFSQRNLGSKADEFLFFLEELKLEAVGELYENPVLAY